MHTNRNEETNPHLRPALWLILSAILAAPILADGPVEAVTEPDPIAGRVLRIRLENDLIIRTDRHFTHGSQVSYLHDEHAWDEDANRLYKVADFLPRWGVTPLAYRWGAEVGQNIYTPDDTSIATVIPTDRPYAGYLFAAYSLDVRGTQGKLLVNDHWSLELGLTGPSALGEDAQNSIHDLRGLKTAKGWANQLETEFGMGLQFNRTWRIRNRLGRLEMDLLPHVASSLGYFFTDARFGGQWRLGWNLPADFGARTIEDIATGSGGNPLGDPTAAPKRGVHAVLGVEGRLVGHNLFISGNLLSDSHGLSPRLLVGDFRIGVAYTGKRWEVLFLQTVRSKEYSGQPEVDSFGSVTIGRRF